MGDRVMDQSEEKIQTIQEDNQQEVMRLNQEVERLHKDNAHLQQQYQQIKQERDSLAHEKDAVERLLSNAKVEIASLTEKYAGLEQQNQQKQDHVDELRRQNQQAQANLEHYRNASLEQRNIDQQRYEQQLKQLEQINQETSQNLKSAKHEKSVLQQENQKTLFENDNLKAHANRIEIQHEAVAVRLNDLTNELAKKAHEQQHWQEKFAAMKTKYDEQNKSFLRLETQHAKLLQQSETVMAELKELRDHNKLLAHEKWEIGQEKALLQGQLKQLESCVDR